MKYSQLFFYVATIIASNLVLAADPNIATDQIFQYDFNQEIQTPASRLDPSLLKKMKQEEKKRIDDIIKHNANQAQNTHISDIDQSLQEEIKKGNANYLAKEEAKKKEREYLFRAGLLEPSIYYVQGYSGRPTSGGGSSEMYSLLINRLLFELSQWGSDK